MWKVEILVVEDGFTSLATGRYGNPKTKMKERKRKSEVKCLRVGLGVLGDNLNEVK